MVKFVSISTKNLLLQGSLILVLVLGSGSMLYAEFQKIFIKQVTNDLDQIMYQNTLTMNVIVDSIKQATLLLYADKTIYDTLIGTDQDAVNNNRAKEAIVNQLAKYIYVPLHSQLTSYQLSFFVKDNLPFAQKLPSSDSYVSGLFNEKQVSSERWYLETVQNDGVLCWFQDTQNKDQFFVARLIKYPLPDAAVGNRQNPVLGVVLIRFNMNQLVQKIESSKLTKSTEIVVLDENRNVLYGNNDTFNQALTRHFSDDNNGNEFVQAQSLTIGDQSYAMNAHRLDNGWQLIAIIPSSEISDRFSIVRKIILNTALISLIIGIAISMFISNKISRPIKRLAQVMRGVHNQEAITQASLPAAGNDEVGMLYTSFNLMMHRINLLLHEVYEIGIKEKEAEFKALQAQINPHFLYNTLDSVNWMAMKIGAKPIAKIISALSNLLRYAIKDANKFVLVADEINQVQQYIMIQSICYEHNFEVVYDIEPNLLAYTMPRLILQPLVENSLQHGIENSEDKGRIQLSGYTEEDTLFLIVSNSGVAVNPDELNEYLKGRELSSDRSGGNGIRNVNQRIQLIFGNKFGLHYEANDQGGGVTAVVKLPAGSSC